MLARPRRPPPRDKLVREARCAQRPPAVVAVSGTASQGTGTGPMGLNRERDTAPSAAAPDTAPQHLGLATAARPVL